MTNSYSRLAEGALPTPRVFRPSRRIFDIRPSSFLHIRQLAFVIDYTRRFFGGRQPLWGKGVTSSIDLMVRPADCRAVIGAFAARRQAL